MTLYYVGWGTMDNPHSTLKVGKPHSGDGLGAPAPMPGLIQIFSPVGSAAGSAAEAMGRPLCLPMALSGNRLELGRGDGSSQRPTDRRMSRRHARVSYDGRRFRIEDLGSQNGTFVDGVQLQAPLETSSAQVLRTGDSLFLLCADLRPICADGVQVVDGRVIGPMLKRALSQIGRAARFGQTLHITGESGVGKEGAARAFHAQGPSSAGQFVAVNCATIPEGVAERLLFGAKRGAFSGAVADTEGYVQAADGGTLFLDEVGELDLAVQAKLLRVIETREVCQLGSTRSRAVKLMLCSASNRDLRAEVGAGRFREDLYFRLSRPQVELPPLRQRLEEIPWLIEQELHAQPDAGELKVHASLVESCLLRHWPGNVRELLAEVRTAAHEALADNVSLVEAKHLSSRAGTAFESDSSPGQGLGPGCPLNDWPGRSAIIKALKDASGNVSAAARILGLHRTQLRRLMERLGMDTGRGPNNLVRSEED